MTLAARLRRFAPVKITADVQALPTSERDALGHLIAAAHLVDGLFLEQAWAGNTALLLRLAGDRSPEGQERLDYLRLNKGPWSRLDHDEIFLPAYFGVPPKPGQANFYPADATRDEVDGWIASLDPEARDQATGFFSRIIRTHDGRLTPLPYSAAYAPALEAIGAELQAAARATTNASLRTFLDARALAFRTNDYYASDVAWMELDAALEPTIGPYETYEDEWFGYKAAFEAFITIRDDEHTARLGHFSDELQGIEDALPIDPKYRNPALGRLAPIRVVNLVMSAGDGNRGVQTAAFNLPNDDRIIRERGAKRVMLKNVQDAKFRMVLLPIARIALTPGDLSRVSFDAFFTHILMHELMHGLGPHRVHDTDVPVRLALKDTYSAIEEAKADLSGLWALQRLADGGRLSSSIADAMYTTFLASAFRSIRFGLNEAHGRGIALQLNSLLDLGAVTVHADGTFAVVDERIPSAVATLTGQIMTIQAEGNYEAAATLLDRMVEIRPAVQRVLDRLEDVPVDIAPDFASARDVAVARSSGG